MRITTYHIIVLLASLSLLSTSCGESNSTASMTEKAITMEETTKKERVLRHVVIFKFNDDSSEEDVNRLNDAFNALPEAIPVIKEFEWGLNDSPENFHQGFTHCYLITFDSEEDRDSVYTPHPAHQDFVASLGPHLEKVFVVDYWTNP